MKADLRAELLRRVVPDQEARWAHDFGAMQQADADLPDRPRRRRRLRRGYAVTTGGACVPPGRLSVIQASISSHQSYSHRNWVS